MFKRHISIVAAFMLLVGAAHLAYADDEQTSVTTSNTAPTIYSMVDDSSNGAAVGDPTNVGSNVTFTVQASDDNQDGWYLAVCKTAAVTHGTGTAAPTCDGGSWAVSSSAVAYTGSPVTEALTYTTTGSETVGECGADNESCAWHAFVCDNSTTDDASECSAVSQGHSARAADGEATNANDLDVTSKVTDSTHNGYTVILQVNDSLNAVAAVSASTDDTNCTVQFDTDSNPSTWSDVVSAIQGDATCNADLTVSTNNGTEEVVAGDAETITLANGFDAATAAESSPYNINHRPSFSAVTITDTGDNSDIQPGDTLRVTITTAQSADADNDAAQDTLRMFVCSGDDLTDRATDTSAFNVANIGSNPCTGGVLLCSDTNGGAGKDPTSANLTCDDTTSLLASPVAHDDYNIEIYVIDNHEFVDASTTVQTVTVENVAPSIGTPTFYTDDDDGGECDDAYSSAFGLNAGTSNRVCWQATVTDTNGDGDLASAITADFFDDAVVNTGCSDDENNCYPLTQAAGTDGEICSFDAASSTGSDLEATGSDTTRVVSCFGYIWFNANPSTQWVADVDVKDDDTAAVTGTASAVEISATPSLDVADGANSDGAASLAYGSIAPGSSGASNVSVYIANKGNIVIDSFVTGSDMCDQGWAGGTQYTNCVTNQINAGQQKFSITDEAYADLDSVLVTPAAAVNAASECANVNVAVRDDHTAPASGNVAIYFNILLPGGVPAGSYTGQNTFTVSNGTGTCNI